MSLSFRSVHLALLTKGSRCCQLTPGDWLLQACFRWYQGSISFSGISFITVRPFDALPHCDTDSIQLADGPDFFPTVKNNLWCGARPVACTRPKSKRAQACTLGCTSGADIWRACSANLRKNKSPDARRPVGGCASLSCFLGRKRALSPLEKAQVGVIMALLFWSWEN